MVQSPVQALAGADLRCVNYCPQAGWYDSCTVSKRASQTTKFAAGSAQTERQWWKVKKARTLDLPDEMTKNYPPAKGQSPSHQHLIQHPSSPTIHLYWAQGAVNTKKYIYFIHYSSKHQQIKCDRPKSFCAGAQSPQLSGIK